MELVNGAQFLHITFILVLLTTALRAALFGTAIVLLTSMYAPL